MAIVGAGAVGRSLRELWPQAYLYDEPKGWGRRAGVNAAEVAFVCVPTPMGDGGACNTAIVEEVCLWIEAPLIVIRSTVPPGTTRRLRQELGKRIIFQPEFGGPDTPGHPFRSPRDPGWVVLGGEPADTARLAEIYGQALGAEAVIAQASSTAAELVKYLDNCYLAAKVTFCNEFASLAAHLDLDYAQLRELWLLDPRVGRSHTVVQPFPGGYGGDCLPKDTEALVAFADQLGVAVPLMAKVAQINRIRRG